MSTVFLLGITSADAVTIRPAFDFFEGEKKIEQNIRVKSGRLYTYKLGSYPYFKFSVDYVAGQNASIINSWWDSNTELLFFVERPTEGEGGSLLLEDGGFLLLEDGGELLLEDGAASVTDVYSVMIISKKTPLRKLRKPYNNYHAGKILLEGY